MQLSVTLLSLATLAANVIGQSPGSGRFCDPLTSICYQSYTDANGISFNIALPNVTAAPFETILHIVSPLKYRWVGFSWGGTMPYVPLTVGWPNGNSTMYSSRMAFGLILPNPYAGAEYTYLKGTGANSTHWTLTVRCRGCSQWTDVDGNMVKLDPANKATQLAHAYSTRDVSQPASNASTFYHHDASGHWSLDLSQARSSSFDQWVASNAIAAPPPPSISTPPASSSIPPASSSIVSIGPSPSTPSPTGAPGSCPGVSAPKFGSVTASGWRAVKVGANLMNPRGLIVDGSGNILVIENGKGVVGYAIDPSSGCVKSSKTLISQTNLNHGIEISPDGKTLFASSMTKVWSWNYDARNMTVGAAKDVVGGMFAGGHTTRTLLIPPKHPNLLVVSHGSNGNWDYDAADIKTERAVVKVFDLENIPAGGGYNYSTGGHQMGYGLRNEVGLAVDGNGMLWGVENGPEEVSRTINTTTLDIHIDNPGEELNYLGDPSQPNTKWYGYPTCFSVWQPSVILDRKFSVGDQFVLEPNSTVNDEMCKQKSTSAKLTMQAHSVPLDAKFSPDGGVMYVSFHGSSDRPVPTGYKVVQIPFVKGADGSFNPKASLDSNTGYTDIWSNTDVTKCTALDCFRPVGIVVDKVGRVYVTSDSYAEGELYMLEKV